MMLYIKFLIFILYLLLQQNTDYVPFHRLPTDIQPMIYKISLSPNLDNFTYTGKQDVFINVTKSTRTVILHSVDLNIKNVSYNDGSFNVMFSRSIKYNTLNETVSINFEKEISLGTNGFLTFEFEGEISEKINGFYRSKYMSNGTAKFAAVTQFAPTDARRCFPCWDEPAVKAQFDISLTVSKQYTAISNTPIKYKNEDDTDLMTVSFERTPIMSTYLVAFIICDYDFIEKSSNSTVLRVYAPKDRIKHGEFSLEVALGALQFYESYFKIKYPLPKIDLVTVADFSFGAMENWGMITYREAVLLIDSANSSTINKQHVALTVAHEMAHQWFGNLVTMEWWTDLWLNEGYASFMEYLCINKLYPSYEIWAVFLTQTFVRALELDALANTHAIEVPIGNPSEIAEIFDQISYSKGASIIRMIHNYIVDEDFQKGMELYLKEHSFSNVRTENLWKSLEEVSNKKISRIMSTWTRLSGFPLVSVTEKTSKNSDSRIFTFTQERFFINGSTDMTNVWMIPITLSSALKTLEVIILDEKTKDIEIKGVSKGEWIKVNAGTVGFFRTLYSKNLLETLLPAIQNQSLPDFDRFGLLDDLFATVQAGRTPTVEFFKLVKEFKNDKSYIVWSCIMNNLNKVTNIISQLEDVFLNFKVFGRNLLSEIHLQLGWSEQQNESHLDTLLRILVLSQMVEFDDEATISEAKRLFHKHVTNESILPPDLRSIVYRAVLSHGNLETFEKVLSLYRKTDMHEEKNRILSCLGAVKDKKLLRTVLEFSLSNEVRPQDAIRAIESVTMNHAGKVLAWHHFKDNSQIFNERFKSGTLLINIVKVVTQRIVSEDILQDIIGFFDKNPILGIERTVQQSIETIRLNIAWLKRDGQSIEQFLKSQESK